MVQEQWKQLEMKFFIRLYYKSCHLQGELTYGRGSLLGGLEFFQVGGGGDEQIFGSSPK